MGIVEIINGFLENHSDIIVANKSRYTVLPLDINKESGKIKLLSEMDNFIDTIYYNVYSREKNYNINKLNELLHKIQPNTLKATEIHLFRLDEKILKGPYNPRTYDIPHTPSYVILGKVYYIEKIGTMIENNLRIISDDELIKKHGESKEYSKSIDLYRRIRICLYPEKSLIDNKLSYDSVLKGKTSESDIHSKYDETIDIITFDKLGKAEKSK